MIRADIAAYLATCHSLAVRELERVLPIHSALGRPLHELLSARPAGPSAGLGAALCLATCRALGGADESALPAASIIELYHHVSEPEPIGTMDARVQSTGHADLTSDRSNAILALTFEPLAERCEALGSKQAIKVLQVVGRMARETAEGRGIETSWLRNGVWALTDADYRGMVLKKRGWRGFVAPTKVGAIVAGAYGEQVASLEQFAADIGFAFQLYDDVTDLSRSGAVLAEGGPNGTRECRHTLPLLFALRASSPERRASLEQALQTRNGTTRDWQFVYDQVRESGGSEYALHLGRSYALRARAALDRACTWEQSSEHGGLLYALVEFAIAKGS